MSDEVRLEGFAERLKGHKMFCIGSPNLLPTLVRSRIMLLDSEVAQRGRKILVIQDESVNNWLLRMKWDAVFVIRESTDLRLALTYVTNCARPVRLVWSGGEPSSQVFQVLSKCEGLSVIGVGTNIVPKQLSEWHAIFWTHDTSVDTIDTTLVQLMGAQVTGKYNIPSVLKEIRGSDLGLVWSSIGESDKRGSLGWFDPSEGSGDSSYSPQEAADLLRSIADSVLSRG